MYVCMYIITEGKECTRMKTHCNAHLDRVLAYFIVHDVNWYMMKLSSNLLSYPLDSTSCIGISQSNNTHIVISINLKSS